MPTKRSPKPRVPVKPINLALQGGGSHGALTWGVLDALLADRRVEIEAISGTSAGAMNAVVLAHGLAIGGRKGASAALARFWERVGEASAFAAPVPGLSPWFPAMAAFRELLSHTVSPYDSNPLDLNPLRDILVDEVDFTKLRDAEASLRLFVAATNVRTGRAAVFGNAVLEVEHVLASACLPQMFHAIEIDGDPYWDGGFTGNPVLWPFFYESATADVVLVQINPIERAETPKTAQQIANRMNEITFNASLQAEIRAVAFVQRLMKLGRLDGLPYRDIRLHRIAGDTVLKTLGAETKQSGGSAFLQGLHDQGVRLGKAWLKQHFADIGVRNTMSLSNVHPGDPDDS